MVLGVYKYNRVSQKKHRVILTQELTDRWKNETKESESVAQGHHPAEPQGRGWVGGCRRGGLSNPRLPDYNACDLSKLHKASAEGHGPVYPASGAGT